MVACGKTAAIIRKKAAVFRGHKHDHTADSEFASRGPSACFLTVWISRTISKTELKSQMNAGHPTVSQNVQRDRKGKREESSGFSLNHHPGLYQQAGGSNSPYS